MERIKIQRNHLKCYQKDGSFVKQTSLDPDRPPLREIFQKNNFQIIVHLRCIDVIMLLRMQFNIHQSVSSISRQCRLDAVEKISYFFLLRNHQAQYHQTICVELIIICFSCSPILKWLSSQDLGTIHCWVQTPGRGWFIARPAQNLNISK